MNEVTTTIGQPATSAAPASSQASRKIGLLLRRFLIPSFVVSAYGYLKLRAAISPRAEVELSPQLQLGPGTRVSSFTKIKVTDGPLVTGVKCGFGTGCFLDSGLAGIRMGDHVICGPNVAIIATNYQYANRATIFEEQGHSSKGIVIGRNVWIGANSVILDGSAIGDNSIVVANSLVNRRFPPNSIIQGNPAKVIAERR
jgi:acetyltransferase-like isoleucine patch superfamily enzyme